MLVVTVPKAYIIGVEQWLILNQEVKYLLHPLPEMTWPIRRKIM